MPFQIASQPAGVIDIVGGDPDSNGGRYVATVTARQARQAADRLAYALAQSPLGSRAVIAEQAKRIRFEMGRGKPDRERVAACLDTMIEAITGAASWVRAGATVVEPIRTIARWLGPWGAAILNRLPAVL
jgi:hypothetical protein